MKSCIVCATDFSANSKNAADWAAFLAAHYRLPLHLYNCFQVNVMVNDVPFPIDVENSLEEGLRGQMHQETNRLHEAHPGLEIRTKVEPGIIANHIVEYAAAHNAGLLVMGISSRGPLEQYMMGSTAVAVALDSTVPVFIVPAAATVKNISNIALATDFNGIEKIKNLDGLISLVEGFDAALELVHVTAEPATAEEKDRLHAIAGLRRFERLKHAIHVVENTSIEQGLTEFVDRYNIDLTVMVHRQHGFFERIFKRSHTDKLAYITHVPLLVLHG